MGDGKQLLERFGNAILGNGELEQIATPDVEYHDASANAKGIAEVEKYLQGWWTAFPDATVTVSNVVSEGDQAVGEMTYSGTQTGPMTGPAGEIPPTGRSVELKGAAWITIRDGKIARFNGYYDTMSMMVQLGLMPAPASV